MTVTILTGCCLSLLATLPDKSVNTCVTSPPYYGLRDYGVTGQLGLEPTPEEYVANMVKVFRDVRRVLRDDGTLWLNIGDTFGGQRGNKTPAPDSKHRHDAADTPGSAKGGTLRKQLLGIPWRVALALQADGWYLRQDIIWHKPNCMPESVTDRCTKAHEYIFLLSKNERYYFDHEAIREQAVKGAAGSSFHKGKTGTHQLGRSSDKERMEDGMRSRRSVWSIPTKPLAEAHFATYPPDLIEPCILAGCSVDGTVIDPFFGAGTTGLVAEKHSRHCIGIELNPQYAEIARKRLGMLSDESHTIPMPRRDAEPQPDLFSFTAA